jgi:tRNA threonylcarbamoyladenosine biosynthesis protein TsaB
MSRPNCLLALDGALGAFSCALLRDGHTVAEATAGNDALEAGLALVERVLAGAGVGLEAVDRLAVGIGPGSFTGLRIAISYAKSIALARRLPLVGISSYDALEPDGVALPVLAVVQGRRGIICARRRDADGSVRVRCGPVADVVAALGEGELTAVGATEDVLAALGERNFVRSVAPRALVPAQAIAELAIDREPASSPHAVRPDYGELPAAKVPKF